MYNCPDVETSLRALDTASDDDASNGTDEAYTITDTATVADLTKALQADAMAISSSGSSSSQVDVDDDDNDMMLTKEQFDALYSSNAAKRNGMANAFHHWPNGVVVVEIDPRFCKLNE